MTLKFAALPCTTDTSEGWLEMPALGLAILPPEPPPPQAKREKITTITASHATMRPTTQPAPLLIEKLQKNSSGNDFVSKPEAIDGKSKEATRGSLSTEAVILIPCNQG
jgi:hypothetical protein